MKAPLILNKFFVAALCAIELFALAPVAQAQMSAPPPGADASAPPPGAGVQPGVRSAYQELPLGPGDAQARIIELRQALSVRADRNLGESITQLGEWLSDMVDAHYRLSQAFAKNATTHREAEQEKSSAVAFKQLKNQAELLKAEYLIKVHRYPEALAPLVEVAASEPQSATGQAAYQHLKDLGFSQEVQYAPPAAEQQSAAQPEPSTKATAPVPSPQAQPKPVAAVKANAGAKTNTAVRQAPQAKPGLPSKPKPKPEGMAGTPPKVAATHLSEHANLARATVYGKVKTKLP